MKTYHVVSYNVPLLIASCVQTLSEHTRWKHQENFLPWGPKQFPTPLSPNLCTYRYRDTHAHSTFGKFCFFSFAVSTKELRAKMQPSFCHIVRPNEYTL